MDVVSCNMDRSPVGIATLLALATLTVVTPGCGSWRHVRTYDRWTLYESPDERVQADAFQAAFEPAFTVIEELFGPFEERVKVHAWHGAVDLDDGRRPIAGENVGIQDVPGIGPARVQAYHARGTVGLFGEGGVFIGAPDPGTAVHELVHARLADAGERLPLWFEEGIACVLGDGILAGGRWQVDGLSYWPLRELREEQIDDQHLARLLAADARAEQPVRENVLVHFVGWAIVFDLYRETGVLDWRIWYERFDWNEPLADARRRLVRTLAPAVEEVWLERLKDPAPAVRLAALQGSWKLRSRAVLMLLVEALEVEEHDDVAVGLAVNVLACAGELDMGWREWRRIARPLRAALRDARLADPEEQRAARDLYLAYRRGQGQDAAQDAMRRLSRYWRE